MVGHRNRSRASRQGLTLVEVIIAVLLFTPILVMILNVFLKNVRGVTETWQETRAVAVGQRRMNDIRRLKWDENTPAGGGVIPLGSPVLGQDMGESSPSDFDDLDDYNGFAAPDPMPGYAQYSTLVKIAYVNVNVITGEITESASQTNYKRVTVTVSGPGAHSAVLTDLFTNSFP